MKAPSIFLTTTSVVLLCSLSKSNPLPITKVIKAGTEPLLKPTLEIAKSVFSTLLEKNNDVVTKNGYILSDHIEKNLQPILKTIEAKINLNSNKNHQLSGFVNKTMTALIIISSLLPGFLLLAVTFILYQLKKLRKMKSSIYQLENNQE